MIIIHFNPTILRFLIYIYIPYNAYVRSNISDQYCNCIITVTLYTWDRPENGYKTLAETRS